MINRLREEAEGLKIELSDYDEPEVDIPTLFDYKGNGYDFSMIVTRSDFDKWCEPLYRRIFDRLDSFLAEAKSKKQVSLEDIGYIVLAGGSCAIPYICQEIERRFPQVEVNEELDKEKLVVNGACMIADNEAQGINIINDIISHSLGVEVYEDGIAKLSKLVCAGEHYPCDRTEVYTTTQDYQEVVEINIYEAGQGKEDVAEIQEGIHDFYGSMVLSGIQRARAGEPEIEVTFSYDKSRCLTVTARDKKTHATKQVVIEKGQIARQPARQQKPMDIVVLLDSSSSMSVGSAMPEAKKACRYLINGLIDLSVHRLGLADFNHVTTVRSTLSQDKSSLLDSVDSIYANGGTYVCPALDCAMGMFNDTSSQRVIIIVTDGSPLDDPYPKIKAMLKSGIRIIAIGVGSSINERNLRKMAGEGDAYHLDDMSQLQDAFETVMNKIMKA